MPFHKVTFILTNSIKLYHNRQNRAQKYSAKQVQTTLSSGFTVIGKGRGQKLSTAVVTTAKDINESTNLPNSISPLIYNSPSSPELLPNSYSSPNSSPPLCPLTIRSPSNHVNFKVSSLTESSQDLFESEPFDDDSSVLVADNSNSTQFKCTLLANEFSSTKVSSTTDWISRESRPLCTAKNGNESTRVKSKRSILSSKGNVSSSKSLPAAKRSPPVEEFEAVKEEVSCHVTGNEEVKTGSDLLALMRQMSERAKELEERKQEYSKFDKEIEQIKLKHVMESVAPAEG